MKAVVAELKNGETLLGSDILRLLDEDANLEYDALKLSDWNKLVETVNL